MLPFTNAARFPNIGRSDTVGPAGTSFVKAAFACSLGFGIAPLSIVLIVSSNDVPYGLAAVERASDGPRRLAAQTYKVGIYVLVASVLIQVMLAGMGIFSGDATYLVWHANYNSVIVFVLPLLLFGIGRYAGVDRRTLWLTVSVSGLVILQSVLLIPYHMDAPGLLRAVAGLHAVNALFIFGVAVQLLERVRERGS